MHRSVSFCYYLSDAHLILFFATAAYLIIPLFALAVPFTPPRLLSSERDGWFLR